MPERDEHANFAPPTTDTRSLLVTLSARALGSLGFGLSILAIWLRWIVPTTSWGTALIGPSDEFATQILPRNRRRSFLPVSSAPIMVNGNHNHNHDSPNRAKHVYFADTPVSQRNSPPTNSPEIPSERLISESDTPSLSTTPEQSITSSVSLSSPLSSPNNVIAKLDASEESVAESDCSSRRSSISCHLPRLMQPFSGKARHSICPSATVTRTSSLDDRPAKRCSGGFTASWSSRHRKQSSPTDTTGSKSVLPFRRASNPRPSKPKKSPSTPSPDSVQSPARTSHFSLKPHRRRSVPTNRARTLPYEAPYFATPPASPESSVSIDLRKSPPHEQVLHEALVNSSRKHEADRRRESDGEPRGRQKAEREAEDGTLPKRRSASESWINGRRTTQL